MVKSTRSIYIMSDGHPEIFQVKTNFKVFMVIIAKKFPRSTGRFSTYYTCQKLLEDTFFSICMVASG